jgi:hypothetical protein
VPLFGLPKGKQMACSSSCPTQDCPSYGACLRGKRLQVADIQAHDYNTRQKRGLNDYVAARKDGLQPDGVFPAQVRRAREISDATGTPYRADQ